MRCASLRPLSRKTTRPSGSTRAGNEAMSTHGSSSEYVGGSMYEAKRSISFERVFQLRLMYGMARGDLLRKV